MKPIYWILIIVVIGAVVFFLMRRKKKTSSGTGISSVSAETVRRLENECELEFNTNEEVAACLQAKLQNVA